MKIVLAGSEAVPFSKTGGLADVASALPKSLAAAGHEVILIVPYYPQAFPKDSEHELPLESTGRTLQIQVGKKRLAGNVLKSQLPGSNVTVLMIDQPDYFDRPGLYQEAGNDFKDNCARFVFFSRTVLETIRLFDIQPQVVHANDWQTGLIPVLLQAEYRKKPGFEQTASVFTIHNMAYQGQFWHWDMLLTGLNWKYFNWRQMEYFGDLNLLKTGIVFADAITTVSPTYAQEIQTKEFGCGLEGALVDRSESLFGILNGVDLEQWNPATDPALIRNYAADYPAEGKAACKLHLQKLSGLPIRTDVPLFGMISRMSEQKGIDLILKCTEEMLAEDVQLCFLGTGDQKYEQALEDLAKQYPQNVSVTIGFNETLAHRIEAGSDAYLMPSRYEPCGLNQMYSLIYGTVPVVRSIGGLADSVIDATPENLQTGTANGFCFKDYGKNAFVETFRRAVHMFAERKNWSQLVQTGMNQDWSWRKSATEYEKVYQFASAKRKETQLV
jgi:starch synthase